MKGDPVSAAKGGVWAIYVVAAACVLCAVGLAAAADLPDAVSAAERIDKLGAMGVLSFALLISLGALVYLIRLQYGRMMQVVDENTKAMVAVTEAIEKCKR